MGMFRTIINQSETDIVAFNLSFLQTNVIKTQLKVGILRIS